MGTRAQFFINNPQDIDNRIWLGTIAWDGYPGGDCDGLAGAASAEDFRRLVALLGSTRNDFCDPTTHSFPFPWEDDLFLTDYTYAFFDGAVQMTCFHTGWVNLADYLADEALAEAYGEGDDQLPENVPAPTGNAGAPKGPDSIMIMSVGA